MPGCRFSKRYLAGVLVLLQCQCSQAVAADVSERVNMTTADHHTTHGCKCLSKWDYKGKSMKYCTDSPSADGKRWCAVSKDCLKAAGVAEGESAARRRSRRRKDSAKEDTMRWDYCFAGPDPRTRHVLTIDPCPASVQSHNGAKPWRANLDATPQFLRPMDGDVANAMCCSKDGKTCGKTSYNEKLLICQADVTHETAKKVCERNGLRLCSVKELQGGVCCHKSWSVCNIQNAWSATEVVVPEYWGEKKDLDYKGGYPSMADLLV